MHLLYRVQQFFQLTRTEALAVLLLTGMFIAGMGIQYIRFLQKAPAAYRYEQLDSLFHQAVVSPEEPIGRVDTVRSDSMRGHPSASTAKLNINTASKEALIALPGIGPRLAERILEYRRQHGAFQTVEDLVRVRGIGPRTLERLRPLVRVH